MTRLKRCAWFPVAAALMALTLSWPAVAQDDAMDAAALLRLAENGDHRAAFLLGSRFAQRGGAEDELAVQWFRVAAKGGLAEAQYNLGYMLANGRGTARDDSEAARWFRRAANQDFAQAQFNLATFHASGRGVKQDEAVAAAWFERAAVSGLAPAQHNLGLMYEHGRGVPQDRDKALAWYEQAASQRYPASVERIAALTSGAAVASRTSARSGDWVARQPPAHYTIQLASYLQPEDAQRFLRSQLSSRDAGIYVASKRGKRWYSVVMGRYETMDEARNAAAELPTALKKLKPWVRRFRTIQKESVADSSSKN